MRVGNGYVASMTLDVDDLRDHELRLVDPAKNRFRIYGTKDGAEGPGVHPTSVVP
jgi:hypothetical protein